MNKQSIDALIANQPHEYYCIVAKDSFKGAVQLPDFATNGKKRFVKEPIRIYTSEKLASQACQSGEEPLHLICLGCFLNVVRSRLKIRTAIINDSFSCDIVAWRAACQTTAILTEGGRRYYIEGCRDSGVFWRPIEEKPTTPPPYLVCGAEGVDCLWYDCPNGWAFMDDDPITLCSTRESGDQLNADALCSVRLETPDVSMFYTGISEEGFDFTRERDQAEQMDVEEAKRVATAIANVQINWSGGMMSNQPGCRVVVADENNKEILSIQ
jgi:hypothetical protein